MPMTGREFKDRLYDQIGRIAKALDSPRRLEMLEVLAQGERPRGEARTGGLRVYYRLAEPHVYDAVRAVRGLAERRLAEIDALVRTYLKARDQLEAGPRQGLLRRARAGGG